MLVNKEENIVQCAAELARELRQRTGGQGWDWLFHWPSYSCCPNGQYMARAGCGLSARCKWDTPYSVEEVLNLLDDKLGTPLSDTDRLELADALHLLNHHLAPNRKTYIHRIKENTLATAVKMHDLTHNMDLSRIPNPVKKDYERVEQYKQEFA